MGWCSGTKVFDDIAEDVLNSDLPEEAQFKVLLKLATSLEEMDWDCQCDSNYWDHPVVLEVMQFLHSDWFKED